MTAAQKTFCARRPAGRRSRTLEGYHPFKVPAVGPGHGHLLRSRPFAGAIGGSAPLAAFAFTLSRARRRAPGRRRSLDARTGGPCRSGPGGRLAVAGTLPVRRHPVACAGSVSRSEVGRLRCGLEAARFAEGWPCAQPGSGLPGSGRPGSGLRAGSCLPASSQPAAPCPASWCRPHRTWRPRPRE